MNNGLQSKMPGGGLILSPGEHNIIPGFTYSSQTTLSAGLSSDGETNLDDQALLSPDMKIFILIINSEKIKRHRF